MRQIFEKELNKVVKEKEFLFDFQIEKAGIYGIEITASAKSWWQNLVNLRSFFKDDDLTLKIDEIEFPKRGLKQRRLFDGEAAFNGNNLKGKKKTNLFLIKLNKGTHTLTFLADQKPKIHSIRVYQSSTISKEKALGQIEENKEKTFQHSAECWNVYYLPKDNYPIEDENRRQWLTIVLVNLGLKNLKITASAKQGKNFFFFKRDDADLKLIINNQIQRNQEPKSHKNWYWCGRTLKGKEKTFEKELNLPPTTHYLELWTDRSPEIREIKIGIGIEKRETYPFFTLDDVKQYAYKGVKENENYNRFDKKILESVNFWNKFFFSQKYPPKEPLNPNLVKAMIYVESRMGYHKRGFPDVMQVWDKKNYTPQTIRGKKGYPANEYISDNQMDHMKYSYPKEWLPPKVKTAKESIFWGIRWLYHKAQKFYGQGEKHDRPPFVRKWHSWEDALIEYNASEKKYKYQKDVLRIYYEGIDPDENPLREKNSQGKIKLFLCLVFAVILILSFGFFSQKFFSKKRIVSRIQMIQKIEFDRKTQLAVLQDVFTSNIGLAIIETPKLPFLKNFKIKKFLPQADFSSSQADHFLWFKAGDFNKDKKKEITFELQYIGTGGMRPFYLYQKENRDFKLLLSLLDSASHTQLKDFNHDGIFEILHSFSLDGTGLAGRTLTRWKEIWAWDGEKYRKANSLYPKIYSNLIKEYEQILKNPPDKEAMIYYRPIIKCLLEKAKQNQKGIFANGRDCLKFE